MPAKDYLVVSFLLTYKTQSDRIWNVRSSICINYRKCVNVKTHLRQDFLYCPNSMPNIGFDLPINESPLLE